MWDPDLLLFFFFAFSVFVGPVNNARDAGKTQTTAVARMTLSKLTLRYRLDCAFPHVCVFFFFFFFAREQ